MRAYTCKVRLMCRMMLCAGSHSPEVSLPAAEAVCCSVARDAGPAAETRQLQHICTASLRRGGMVFTRCYVGGVFTSVGLGHTDYM